MHDRSRFSEIDMTASLPERGEQAPFGPSTLFAEAWHVHQHVNRRYYEHLLTAVEDRAAALGLAFTKTPGAGPAQLSGEEVAALEQALVDARHLWCFVLVPPRERHHNVGREVAEGVGIFWLQWTLDALSERGFVPMRRRRRQARRDRKSSALERRRPSGCAWTLARGAPCPGATPCAPTGGRAVNDMRRLPAQGEDVPAATRRRHVHAAPHLRIPFGHRLSDQAGQPKIK